MGRSTAVTRKLERKTPKMFLPRKAPPLISPRLSFQSQIRCISAYSLRIAQARLDEPTEKKKGKKGPPKGKPRDPNDPTKFVSRATLINFRPRGKTKIRSADKSTQLLSKSRELTWV